MEIKLMGKVVITGKIRAETGLSIGGATVGLDIGGLDNPVIRDPITERPYIPGSSLKGKIRSLLEKAEGLEFNANVGGSRIHQCEDEESFSRCKVCKIFGLPGEKGFGEPTRLIVRDAFLTERSTEMLKEARTDLPYTEVKWENVIDRITAAANPRQMERVPEGAEFEFGMIYNIFSEGDKSNLKEVFKSLELLEHDYLGGSGSRGYGRVKFEDIKVYWNSKADYESGDVEIEKKEPINGEYTTPADIVKNFEAIREEIR